MGSSDGAARDSFGDLVMIAEARIDIGFFIAC